MSKGVGHGTKDVRIQRGTGGSVNSAYKDLSKAGNTKQNRERAPEGHECICDRFSTHIEKEHQKANPQP